MKIKIFGLTGTALEKFIVDNDLTLTIEQIDTTSYSVTVDCSVHQQGLCTRAYGDDLKSAILNLATMLSRRILYPRDDGGIISSSKLIELTTSKTTKLEYA